MNGAAQPAAHIIYVRACAHLNEDARQIEGGALVCDLCGSPVTPRLCTGPTQQAKRERTK